MMETNFQTVYVEILSKKTLDNLELLEAQSRFLGILLVLW